MAIAAARDSLGIDPYTGLARYAAQPMYSPVLQDYRLNAPKQTLPTGPYSYAPGYAALAGGNVQGGQPVSEANPFSTISNTKNPAIKSVLDKILGSVDAATGRDPNANPYMLRTNTLDPAQEARVQAAAGSLPSQQAAQQQSLADFTKQYLAGIQQAQPYQQQEASAIGQFYDTGPGGVQSTLDAMAKQRQQAVSVAVQRAMDRILGQANQQRLTSGDSSYLQALGANQASNINAQEAINQADLGRTNYLAVKQAQADLMDKRRQGIDALNQMYLLPIQAQQALTSQNLGQLDQAGNLIRSNNIYRTETPEDVISRQLGLVGQASNVDLANTFYGLNKPYQPDFSGYVNPRYGGQPTNYGNVGGGYQVPQSNPYQTPYANLGYAVAPQTAPNRSPANPYQNVPPYLTNAYANRPDLNVAGPPSYLAPDSGAASQAYYNQTGVNPNQDPYYNDWLFNNLYQGGG